MFRLDEDRVVDATLSGGLARYINHSCNPNCVTEIVEVDREFRIIIFAKRRINRGEEVRRRRTDTRNPMVRTVDGRAIDNEGWENGEG